MLTITVKAKNGATLRQIATEIQALNQYVGQIGTNPETGEDWFPRPIACNPDSEVQEGFVGDCNTPMDSFGRFQVMISNYEYIDWDALPAQPQTFSIISGKPATTGAFA